MIQGKLSLSTEVMRREPVVNAATYLLPRYRTEHIRRRSVMSIAALGRSLARGRVPGDAMAHASHLAKAPAHLAYAAYRRLIGKPLHYPWIAIGGWSDLPDKPKEFGSFEVCHLVEQLPDPENRLTLAPEVDPLGRRKVKLDCRLREPDLAGFRRLVEIFGPEFRRAGLGRFEAFPPTNYTPSGSGHHCGTTRMDPDPRRGVVDIHGRVHGVSNLFVTGSSVFPTASYANPTLTIVALAIRLADQIRADPGPRSPDSPGSRPLRRAPRGLTPASAGYREEGESLALPK